MPLRDLFNYMRRNIRKMNEQDKVKMYDEIKRIMKLLERELKIN